MNFKTPYICITDFEATCWENDPVKRREMEIIEIGSVLIETKTLKMVGEYDRFVKPVRNPVLSDFCKKLTTITEEQLNHPSKGGKTFPDVFKQWVGWMGDVNNITFASWGAYDYNQLVKDCNYHKVTVPVFADVLNIKTAVAAARGKAPQGVGRTLESLGLKFEGTPHRGIDDAKNILRIIQKVNGKVFNLSS